MNATPPRNGMLASFKIFGQTVGKEQRARVNFASPDYFRVLHIPPAAGPAALARALWRAAEIDPVAALRYG